ncbi:trigger factor [Gloeocapsopsis crepidinum LEGE 06123]|uniref:Trigger factor n=1 Tax=Gloeocapsopsis crepidinum LEGE 06123 TaxID=588587 RepID=A0ABR9UUY4_9CHRO|nr:trigger factor [Gloeocapsopsis crepidinum]MBE9192086.1 trigger factor [Gloeocapsopsis crepidinum LEGE 06123]
MKVTQEKLPASQIGLAIEISAEKSQQTYDQVIQKLTRTMNVPGFRKGKVPRQILLQRLGSVQVKAAALEELIQTGITEAIKQEDIQAIGQPQLRSSFEELIAQYEPGQALQFSAAVDVQPEVNLTQYTDLHVKAEEVKYNPEKVDNLLAEQRSEMATLIPVEGRAAQLGDVAIVDFKGYLAQEEEQEPQEIAGASADDFQLELQQERFIPGFIDGIVGMQPGETKEVTAQFPEDYPQQEVAGRAATFTITLKELKEKELPELDDDFAQEVSEFQTLAELRSSLEERFKAEAERQTKANKEQALTNELVKYLEVDLPETLIAQEVNNMLTQAAVQLSQQGIDVKKLFTQESVAKLRENSRPEAIERLRSAIALQEIAQRESIKVEKSEVEAKVKELLSEYSNDDIDINRLREVVEEDLLKEKIMSWLEDRSTMELLPEGSLSASADSQQEVEAALSDSASDDSPLSEVETTA